jgi:regulation of enolase protein 1 (concanavalin A-like superfamily)
MNKKLILISFFFFSCQDIGIENQNKVSNKSFINAFGSNWYEYGWGITQTHDGGFIITGRKEIRSSKSYDMITIRTDENGFGIWENTFGGSGNEEGYSVVQVQDGNILSVGYSSSYGNGQEVFVVKTDLSGHKLWQKTYGGSNRDVGHKVITTNDGNILIIGQTNSPGIAYGNDDVWLLKIDLDGNEIWNKSYGHQKHEVGYDIVELEEGGFLIVGYRDFYDQAGKDILIIEIDNNGNEIWEKTIGVDGKYDEKAYSISKSKNYGYLITASTNAKKKDRFDPQVINIDFDGNIIWNKTYNGSGLQHTRWVGCSTNDGGIAILGTTNYYQKPGSNEDAYIINIDKNGDKFSDYAVQGGKNDWGWALIETFSNELVLVGSTKSFGAGLYDILLAKIVKSDQ